MSSISSPPRLGLDSDKLSTFFLVASVILLAMAVTWRLDSLAKLRYEYNWELGLLRPRAYRLLCLNDGG